MTSRSWNDRRMLVDAHNRYIVEADALLEVERLTRALAAAQEDAKTAFALAEDAQKELDAAQITMETLRALASVNLNREPSAHDRHGLAKERAEAEAQAWVRKYQEMEARLDAALSDGELLAFLLVSFSSSPNGWHWLHITVQGDAPRAALELLKANATSPSDGSGFLTANNECL